MLCIYSNQHIVYATDVDFESIGNDDRCDGLTGADLSNLLREASLAAIREYRTLCKNKNRSVNSSLEVNGNGNGNNTVESAKHQISLKHFEMAFDHAKPSVPYDERLRFESVRDLLKNDNKHPLEALRIAKEQQEQRQYSMLSSSKGSKNSKNV